MKATTNETNIRVLKTGTCPSLSGKSKLTYEIGCSPESDLLVRISKNSGTGFFSDAWVTWEQLQRALAKNGTNPITSFTLRPLFKGQSVNTPGFLMAALKNEQLLQNMKSNPRCYECLDGTAFMKEVTALMGAPASAAKKARPKAPAVGSPSPAAKPRASKS